MAVFFWVACVVIGMVGFRRFWGIFVAVGLVAVVIWVVAIGSGGGIVVIGCAGVVEIWCDGG